MDRKLQKALETEAVAKTADALLGTLSRLDRVEETLQQILAILTEPRPTPERKGGRA